MVSFFGVYVHVQNRMENKVKEYALDMDLKGARHVKLVANTESKEVIKDANGNEVETEEEMTDEQLAEKGYTKESVPNKWESSGIDGYTIVPAEKDSFGTEVILTIKTDSEEENYSKYLETYEIESLVRKYSDYITYPIKMEVSHTYLKDKKNEQRK